MSCSCFPDCANDCFLIIPGVYGLDHLLAACTNAILHLGHIFVAEPADVLGIVLKSLGIVVDYQDLVHLHHDFLQLWIE